MNMLKLKGKIMEKGLNQSELAKKMGIDKSTLNRKLKNGLNFTIGDARKISTELGLTKEEAMAIFFSDTVA